MRHDARVKRVESGNFGDWTVSSNRSCKKKPRRALDEAGARTEVVSLKKGEIKGWRHKEWGDAVAVDETPESVEAEDHDALLLPGGVMNPDNLRMEPKAVAFVKAFFDEEKNN